MVRNRKETDYNRNRKELEGQEEENRRIHQTVTYKISITKKESFNSS
jgi:hypothetical protein